MAESMASTSHAEYEEDEEEQPERPQKGIKRKKTATCKKWTWKDEYVEALIAEIKDFKSICDFNGLDFEADLKELYVELHRRLAGRFPETFGPAIVTDPPTSVKEMTCEEYQLYKKTTAEEKVQIAKMYDRIKTKVKSIRQDYRSAVNKGTRSGSGKLVKEHFDTLCQIWGGSPATNMLAEGVDGDSLLKESIEEHESSLTEELSSDKESFQGNEGSLHSEEPADDTGAKKKAKMSVSAVPHLVDNKRKQMEKSLSAAKRDQIFMNATKEDLIMKKQMITSLEKSNESLQSTMQKMTESMSSMAEGISAGMRMIAMAMASPSQMQFHSSQRPEYNNVMFASSMQGPHVHAMGYDSVRYPHEFSDEGNHLTSLDTGRRSYTPSPTPSDQVSFSGDENTTTGYVPYNRY